MLLYSLRPILHVAVSHAHDFLFLIAGYGRLNPRSTYVNTLVCVQAFWGMLTTAVITGKPQMFHGH